SASRPTTPNRHRPACAPSWAEHTSGQAHSVILAFRLRARHLDRRLPRDRIADAAAGGLQDTVPRAALLGLHARLEGADPGSWEDQALSQTYGPRGAVYIFQRDAVPAFTRGLLPRDDADREQIESVAARVADALTNGPLRQKELAAVAPEFDGLGFHAVRLAARAGRYLIR